MSSDIDIPFAMSDLARLCDTLTAALDASRTLHAEMDRHALFLTSPSNKQLLAWLEQLGTVLADLQSVNLALNEGANEALKDTVWCARKSELNS